MKIRKQHIFIFIEIMAILLAIVSVSYATFSFVNTNRLASRVQSGTISMGYSESNVISISNAVPMSDDDGRAQDDPGTYFDFSVSASASGEISFPYQISVTTLDTNTLDASNVKIHLSRQDNSELNSTFPTASGSTSPLLTDFTNFEAPYGTGKFRLEENTSLIHLGAFILNNEMVSHNYRLRMWVKDTYEISDESYTFALRVNVDGADVHLLEKSLLTVIYHDVMTGDELGRRTQYYDTGSVYNINPPTIEGYNPPSVLTGTIVGPTTLNVDYTSSIPDYKNVSYLESTGTQYINTGYKLTTDNVEYNVKYVNNVDENNSIYGSETSTSPKYTGIWYRNNGNRNLYIGNANVSSFAESLNTVYDLTTKITSSTAGQYIINGETHAFNYSGGLQKTLPIYLFANNFRGVASQKLAGKIYNFSIKDNGILVRDLVPVIKYSTSEAGMYDRVNNVFYSNNGSGTFTTPSSSTLTVIYRNSDGVEIGRDSILYENGSNYTIEPPLINGYDTIVSSVTGTINSPTTRYVDYTAVVEESLLTIIYRDELGVELGRSTQLYKTGSSYNISVPTIANYTTKQKTISGIITKPTTVYVFYSSIVPGYKVVSYLEGTGTQYIDTKYMQTSTSKLQVDFALTNLTQDSVYVGGISSGNRFGYLRIYSGNMVTSSTGSSYNNLVLGTKDLLRHSFVVDTNLATNNIFYDDVVKGTYTYTTLGTKSYTLFGLGTIYKSKVKIYAFKAWNGDTLVKNFIPVVSKLTGVKGMYDQANNLFYPNNSSTGTFVTPNSSSLTIIYRDNVGNELGRYSMLYENDSTYNVPFPEIEGYEIDRNVYEIDTVASTGTITAPTTLNVIYNRTSPDASSLLTIIYRDNEGDEIGRYSQLHENGSTYNITPPTIQGYETETTSVTGTITGSTTRYVEYLDLSTTSILTIIYEDVVVGELQRYTQRYINGSTYSVESPTIDGYATDTPVVTGTIASNTTLYISYYESSSNVYVDRSFSLNFAITSTGMVITIINDDLGLSKQYNFANAFSSNFEVLDALINVVPPIIINDLVNDSWFAEAEFFYRFNEMYFTDYWNTNNNDFSSWLNWIDEISGQGNITGAFYNFFTPNAYNQTFQSMQGTYYMSFSGFSGEFSGN